VRRRRKQSARPTLGIEEEFFVVSRSSGEPVDVPAEARLELHKSIGDVHFAEEYKRAQIELRTGIHDNPDTLRNELLSLRFTAATVLKRFGLAIMAVATHPTADWRTMASQLNQRYLWIEDRKGDAVRQLAVAGAHIHVGTFDSDDERVARIEAYRPLIAVLIAAAPSSPFFVGRDTGHASWRRNIVTGLGLQTVTTFGNAAERWQTMTRLQRIGALKADSDFWADIRLGTTGKPTVEIRCPDISPYVDDGASMAAFVQAYEFAVRRGVIKPPDRRGEADLFFADHSAREASRYGAKAVIIDPWSREPTTLRAYVDRLAELLVPLAADLGTGAWLAHFTTLFERDSPAESQRQAARSSSNSGATDDDLAGPVQTEQALNSAIRWAIQTTEEPPRFAWPTPAYAGLLPRELGPRSNHGRCRHEHCVQEHRRHDFVRESRKADQSGDHGNCAERHQHARRG
jgi:carboxylate-amine ligase